MWVLPRARPGMAFAEFSSRLTDENRTMPNRDIVVVGATHRPALDQLAARLCERETFAAEEIASVPARAPLDGGPALAYPALQAP